MPNTVVNSYPQTARFNEVRLLTRSYISAVLYERIYIASERQGYTETETAEAWAQNLGCSRRSFFTARAKLVVFGLIELLPSMRCDGANLQKMRVVNVVTAVQIGDGGKYDGF